MTAWAEALARRMAGPQRHRLLQGFPMLPLMREAVPRAGEPDAVHAGRHLDGGLAPIRPDGPREPAWIDLDATRPLLIGVLPHAQCIPRVEGCGFCTFPHDRHDKVLLAQTVDRVEEQLRGIATAHPAIAARRVLGVYLGGATANLTPAKVLRPLAETLATCFDLREAEVTLEGIPSLFRSLLAGPFEVLRDLPARHRRISMGVQTFDAAMLARMGRQAFGDRATVARVVEKAHAHGMTASADFLINLPHHPLPRTLDDLREAAAMGLDQICLYHLVLTPEMGTPWAADPAMLAALPSIADACAHWLAARDWLLANGYVQTTLTNFERAEIHATPRRFVYEELSFTPERVDALGVGPHAISTFVDLPRRRAVKHVRGKSLHPWRARDLYFGYDEADLRLYMLTRSLPRLRVARATYRDLFATDLVDDFAGPIAAVVEAGLAAVDDDALTLTPRGMFYADAIAGLLASERVEILRAGAAGRHTRDALDEQVFREFMG
ncbi:MAG: Fe-S oxidoreductase [Deltaproteobacteria bacterium]|nr:Fe-S oxidoreductase [Deltaproteobacteria bacterium]